MEFLEFYFGFYAADFERSVHFYEHTLGLRRIGGWDRPDGRGALLAATVDTGGANEAAPPPAVIEIFGAPRGQAYSGPPPASIRLALRLPGLDELEAAYQRLAQSGERVAGPPVDRPWGHRDFLIYDPDGIPVYLYAQLGTGR